MDCLTVESKGSRIPQNIAKRNAAISGGDAPIWSSMVFCPEGYNLMDCTAYNEASMKDCDQRYYGFDKVSAIVYHGADLMCMADKGAHCSASGYTPEMRVQAICCKILPHHHDD